MTVRRREEACRLCAALIPFLLPIPQPGNCPGVLLTIEPCDCPDLFRLRTVGSILPVRDQGLTEWACPCLKASKHWPKASRSSWQCVKRMIAVEGGGGGSGKALFSKLSFFWSVKELPKRVAPPN